MEQLQQKDSKKKPVPRLLAGLFVILIVAFVGLAAFCSVTLHQILNQQRQPVSEETDIDER